MAKYLRRSFRRKKEVRFMGKSIFSFKNKKIKTEGVLPSLFVKGGKSIVNFISLFGLGLLHRTQKPLNKFLLLFGGS